MFIMAPSLRECVVDGHDDIDSIERMEEGQME
jgi:hypothetical protein